MSRYEANEHGDVLRLDKDRPGWPARREVLLSTTPGKARRIAGILNQPDDGPRARETSSCLLDDGGGWQYPHRHGTAGPYPVEHTHAGGDRRHDHGEYGGWQLAPVGKTVFGMTVWPVPGRRAGQRDGIAHLTWEGPGAAVELCRGGTCDPGPGHMHGRETPGQPRGRVSGPCATVEDAQHAVDVFLAGAEHRPCEPGQR